MAEIGVPEKRVVVIPLENPIIQPAREPRQPAPIPEREPEKVPA